MTTTEPRFTTIRMADDEWSGHEGGRLMEIIALDYLKAHPDTCMVEVMEHGGWWLDFAMINGELQCVASANDMARWNQEIKDWWAAHKDMRYGGSVDRQQTLVGQ